MLLTLVHLEVFAPTLLDRIVVRVQVDSSLTLVVDGVQVIIFAFFTQIAILQLIIIFCFTVYFLSIAYNHIVADIKGIKISIDHI